MLAGVMAQCTELFKSFYIPYKGVGQEQNASENGMLHKSVEGASDREYSLFDHSI